MYELASELSLSARQLVVMLRSMGFDVLSASAVLTARQVAAARNKAAVTAPPALPGQLRRSNHEAADDVARSLVTRCPCCLMAFKRRELDQRECPACSDHRETEDETPERTIGRLTAHDSILRRQYAEIAKRMSALSEEDHSRSREAFKVQRRWVAALVEVMLQHGRSDKDGGCTCGAVRFPCSTWGALEAANPGIARKVERYVSMDDSVREGLLYEREPDRFIDIRSRIEAVADELEWRVPGSWDS